MDLLRISVSKDSCLPRTQFDSFLNNILQPLWAAPLLEPALPRVRNSTDNVRCALAYALRPWLKFEQDDARCKVLAVPTKGAKGLDICIHVQARGTDSVEYSDLVCRITGGTLDQPITTTATEAGLTRYPALVADVQAATLERHGAHHLYDNDIRRLCDALMSAHGVPLWPATLLVNASAKTYVAALGQLQGILLSGTISLSLLSLDDTPANRDALAHELAVSIGAELSDVHDRLYYVAPSLGPLRKVYDRLCFKIAHAEQLLGVPIPCSTQLDAIDARLEALELTAASQPA
jgi:hypothetical protein